MTGYLNDFERVYRLDRIHGISRFLAAAAAHHRFMWIHPFMDGNGRTGRLFTDQYIKAAGFAGYGLWSMSRGFAQNLTGYYAMLNAADHPRRGEYDGRGELSDSGLLRWTKFFAETALNQVQYFSTQLEPERLSKSIDAYFEMRSRGTLSNYKDSNLPSIRIEARVIYKALLDHGEQQYLSLQARLGIGESATRSLLHQMANEKLITINKSKLISPNLPPHLIGCLFPGLW